MRIPTQNQQRFNEERYRKRTVVWGGRGENVKKPMNPRESAGIRLRICAHPCASVPIRICAASKQKLKNICVRPHPCPSSPAAQKPAKRTHPCTSAPTPLKTYASVRIRAHTRPSSRKTVKTYTPILIRAHPPQQHKNRQNPRICACLRPSLTHPPPMQQNKKPSKTYASVCIRNDRLQQHTQTTKTHASMHVRLCIPMQQNKKPSKTHAPVCIHNNRPAAQKPPKPMRPCASAPPTPAE